MNCLLSQTHVYLSANTQVSYRGSRRAVLSVLSQVSITERADAAQRIVLCGAKQPGELLHELSCMAKDAPVCCHLMKLTDKARIVPALQNSVFVPWFDEFVRARTWIDIGNVVVDDE